MGFETSKVGFWLGHRSKRQRFLILVAALVLVSVITMILWPYAARVLRTAPDHYASIRIGDSKEAVEYKLGVPKYVLDPPQMDKKLDGFFQFVHTVNGDPATDKSALKAGDDFTKYNYWQYAKADANEDPTISVIFDKDKKTKSISCMALKHSVGACEPIFGIGIDEKEDAVTERLGKPDLMKYSGITKSIFYERLHLILTLEKQRVYIIQLLKDGDYHSGD